MRFHTFMPKRCRNVRLPFASCPPVCLTLLISVFLFHFFRYFFFFLPPLEASPLPPLPPRRIPRQSSQPLSHFSLLGSNERGVEERRKVTFMLADSAFLLSWAERNRRVRRKKFCTQSDTSSQERTLKYSLCNHYLNIQ